MSESLSGRRRRRAVVLAAAGVVVVLVVLSFALVGDDLPPGGDRVTGRDRDEQPPAAAGALPDPPMATTPNPLSADDDSDVADRGLGLASLPDTDDPDAYAAAVAGVLFGMDYTSHEPGDYEALFAAALWDEIDTDSRTRIMATIARRIPTVDMWEQMRSVEQTAEFDVELVWEPRTARTHTDRGDWPDGWGMRNVSGTQTETWRTPGEDRQTSTRPVAVTLVLACPPATSPCRLIGIMPHVES